MPQWQNRTRHRGLRLDDDKPQWAVEPADRLMDSNVNLARACQIDVEVLRNLADHAVDAPIQNCHLLSERKLKELELGRSTDATGTKCACRKRKTAFL